MCTRCSPPPRALTLACFSSLSAAAKRTQSNNRALARVSTRVQTPQVGSSASVAVAAAQRKPDVTPGTALISPFQRAGLFSPVPTAQAGAEVKGAKGSTSTSPMAMSAPQVQRAGGGGKSVTGRKRKAEGDAGGAASAAPHIRSRSAATPREKLAILDVEEEETYRRFFERQMFKACVQVMGRKAPSAPRMERPGAAPSAADVASAARRTHPLYCRASRIVDAAVLSDCALVHTPLQIAAAALLLASTQLAASGGSSSASSTSSTSSASASESESETMTRVVHATALLFFKRFYVAQTVMDYDPKIVMFAAILLACKVEEEDQADIALKVAQVASDIVKDRLKRRKKAAAAAAAAASAGGVSMTMTPQATLSHGIGGSGGGGGAQSEAMEKSAAEKEVAQTVRGRSACSLALRGCASALSLLLSSCSPR